MSADTAQALKRDDGRTTEETISLRREALRELLNEDNDIGSDPNLRPMPPTAKPAAPTAKPTAPTAKPTAPTARPPVPPK